MKMPGFVFVLAMLAAPVTAFAQTAPDQMCGNGTTFTVELPGQPTGIDDSRGIFRSIDVPPLLPPDSITLPNGCSVYAFLVAGFSQNPQFDEILFYKFAEYVAQNNGYVHMSWWNNLLAPYMERPLHNRDITIERLFGLVEPLIIQTGPENPHVVNRFESLFAPAILDLPKANPDEDFQFQSDAALVIKAIKQHNPTAIVVVAGHSMGGASVVRLGLDKTVPIDLLAPIDAGNNRDTPDGIAGTRTANRSRWRSAFDWRGYRQWDCVRNSGGVCHDFDDRFFFFQFRCAPTGPFLPVRPLFATRAPLVCPAVTPYIDPGRQNAFGDNVAFLYNRWQNEFGPPSDFLQSYTYKHWKPLSTSLLAGNYQRAVPTCALGIDPIDPSFLCAPTDGHGEIVGHRGALGNLKPGLAMRGDWPGREWPEASHDAANAALRRTAMIGMRTADAAWPFRPQNPDLCLVCDDMIAIVGHLLASVTTPPPPIDATAPNVVATTTPEPNAAGWHNGDVIVQVSGVDEPQGSGVKEISVSFTGAQLATTVTPGAEAQATISAAGLTTMSYFARDNAGNAGTPAMLLFRIDKTSPQIAGETDGVPNGHGWFNRNVTVSFIATDEAGGSGLASVSPSAVVSAESAHQEIAGTASDVANNESTARVTLSIDKTAPSIAIASPPDGSVFLLNAAAVASFGCADALSGLTSCAGSTASGAPLDTATVGAKSLVVTATDAADNGAASAHVYSVRFAFSGFLNPAASLPAVNIAKAGRTVPIKYSLADANGQTISDLATFLSLTSQAVACATGEEELPAEETDSPGSTTIRFDDGQFLYNWKTASTWTGCRMLELRLSDGSVHQAKFQFK